MLSVNYAMVASGSVIVPNITIILRAVAKNTESGIKFVYDKEHAVKIAEQLSLANYSQFDIYDVSKDSHLVVASIKVTKQNPIVEIID